MSNWKGREKDSSSNRNFNTAAYLGGTGTANVPPRSVKVVDFAKV